jgi:hypothetical protein
MNQYRKMAKPPVGNVNPEHTGAMEDVQVVDTVHLTRGKRKEVHSHFLVPSMVTRKKIYKAMCYWKTRRWE